MLLLITRELVSTVCEPAATCALGTLPVPLSVRVSLLTPVLTTPLVPKAAGAKLVLAL